MSSVPRLLRPVALRRALGCRPLSASATLRIISINDCYELDNLPKLRTLVAEHAPRCGRLRDLPAVLDVHGEGADDPAGRKIPDPGSGGEIPLKLRSLPYGTACDVCDGGLNQCEEPPNAQGGHWPKAPSTAPMAI